MKRFGSMVTPPAAAVTTMRATARESPPSAKKSSSSPTEGRSSASAQSWRSNSIWGVALADPSGTKTPALFSSCPGTDISPLHPIALQKRHKRYAHEDLVLHREIILTRRGTENKYGRFTTLFQFRRVSIAFSGRAYCITTLGTPLPVRSG